MLINAKPSITTTTLPNVSAGSLSYSQTLATSGGTAPISCAITSGSLIGSGPYPGCTITGTGATLGIYSFTVTPTDSDGVSGSGQALFRRA